MINHITSKVYLKRLKKAFKLPSTRNCLHPRLKPNSSTTMIMLSMLVAS